LIIEIVLCTVVAIAVLSALIFPVVGKVSAPISQNTDGTRLRQIGQAMLKYATDADNTGGVLSSSDFPVVPVGNAGSGRHKDIYEVAALLVRDSDIMNDPWFWVSRYDAIFPPLAHNQLTTVVDPAQEGFIRNAPLNPKFKGAALAYAVAIFPTGTKLNDLPTSTPLAWTRGLQADGTWSKTLGTYGDWGGFIVFAGGNLEKFKSIDGKLVKFGTNEPTSNILEALPPGSRISEFAPPKK
jgi:hypothetical protein